MFDHGLAFFDEHPLLAFCVLFIAVAMALLCRARVRRLQQRERRARALEDSLLQNTQGMILNCQGIVKGLGENDPARQRLQHALDRADEALSEDRDRVEDLRTKNSDQWFRRAWNWCRIKLS